MKNIIIFALLLISSSAFASDRDIIIDEDFRVKNNLSLDIDIDGAELQVVKGNKRNKIHVYMKFDKDRSKGNVRFNEKRGTMDVIVNTEKWIDHDNDRNGSPKVLVELPTNTVLEIETRIKAGEINFELGGLSITNFLLKNWAGEVNINFDEPNETIMKTFDMNCKVGEVTIQNLGNARFEYALINGGIGEMNVDFKGDLLESSDADIDLDLGETHIILPEKVGIKAKVSKMPLLNETNMPHWFEKRGTFYYSENYDSARKQLFLAISSGIGELRLSVE